MRFFWRHEEGQSLIIIAGAFALLLGAVAFGVDQGYAFVQRREMVNAAQSGAFAGGRLIAQSVILTASGSPVFTSSQADVYAKVKQFVLDNSGSAFRVPTQTLRVDFLKPDGTSMGSLSCNVADASCPASAPSIDPSVRDIRVTSTVSYRSLFATFIGQPSLTAAGQARVRIVGAPLQASGGNPPAIVRHYDPNDFAGVGCASPCTTWTNADIVTFWDSNGAHTTFGNFKGVVDFARASTRQSGAKQMITSWDKSHSVRASTATWPDITSPAKCTGGTDTNGNPNGFDTEGTATLDTTYEKTCSIPNWNYRTFYGKIDLKTDWLAGATGGEPPSDLGSRPLVCNASTPAYLSAPSCATGAGGTYSLGDWVETYKGTWGSNIADTLKQAITDRGVTTDLSSQNIPGTNTKFGKALVMSVLLWDCGEEYKASNPAGSQWSLIMPTGGRTDCSDTDHWGGNSVPDRVHIFTAAPFTFYYGLVSDADIGGFWGGSFGDPESCADYTKCADINAVSNTVVAVPDDAP